MVAAKEPAHGRLCALGGGSGTLDDRHCSARTGRAAEERGGHREAPKRAWPDYTIRNGHLKSSLLNEDEAKDENEDLKKCRCGVGFSLLITQSPRNTGLKVYVMYAVYNPINTHHYLRSKVLENRRGQGPEDQLTGVATPG
jgi:hypothetical protein